MILFRKYYKAANDEIKPKRELIEKVFDEYEKENVKNDKSKVYRFGMRYGTAIAACLVICFAIFAYPQISKLNETPDISKTDDFELYVTQDNSFNYTIDEAEDISVKQTEDNVTDPKSNAKKMLEVDEKSSITSRTINAPNVDTKSYEINISELKTMTDDEIGIALRTLEERFGKEDKETGNLYSFEIVGRLDTDDASYYLGRWRWLVDDHSSLICEFVMKDDLSGLYECSLDGNMVKWITEKNMFD